MKTLALLVLTSLLLTSCSTRAGTGAIVGTGLGAGLGAIAGGGTGALIGGAAGMATGALVGNSMDHGH